jgi:hypothetical protein
VKILESVNRIRGTLDPEKLKHISEDDRFKVWVCTRCLKFYGQEINEFTLAGFKEGLSKLGKIEVPVILNNYIYPARNAGKNLKLPAKIQQGLMSTALNVEGARLYLKRVPELVANIILDIKNELFGK